MSGHGGDLLIEDRLAWLLVIGRRLKAQYDAIAMPVPSALAVLLEQLEAREKRRVPEPSGPESP
jgi:hypothetical protein